MPDAICLSLAGRGQVVRLTPRTARAAFFRFVSVNRLSAAELHAFDLPWQRSPGFATSPLDRLHRRGTTRSRRDGRHGHANPCASPSEPALPYLTPFEVRAVEQQMNRMLLDEGRALVSGEGTVQEGAVPSRSSPRLLRARYVVRHGIVFELAPLGLAALLQGGKRDVCIEWADHSICLARFLGVKADVVRGRLVLCLAARFDLAKTWAVTTEQLRKSWLYTLRRAAAWPGFHIAEWEALLQG